MILPKFQTYQKNMNLYYMDLSKYFEYLKNEMYSGYVRIIVDDGEYLVFFNMGEIFRCLNLMQEKIKEVDSHAIFEFAGENYFLHAFALSEDLINYFANIFFNELQLKNLTTEFINIIKLLNKLRKEQLTGFVKINIVQSIEGRCYIYFKNGEIIGFSESWHKWVFENNRSKLNAIINKIQKATFNVYEIVKSGSIDHNELFDQVVSFFEGYFKILEQAFDKDNFSVLLKKSSLSKADKYNFLDPFADEFEYKDGKIRIWNGFEANEVARALKELCIDITRECTDKRKKTIKDAIKSHCLKYKGLADQIDLSGLNLI